MMEERSKRKFARLAEVAAHAKVSKGLVSRILNEDKSLKVKPETRRRVLESVTALGYAPQSSAKALRRANTRTIGFVINKISNPMYTDMIDEAQRTATELGYVLLLVDASELKQNGRLFREIVLSRRLDGLLLQGGYGKTAQLLLPYADLIPSVIFNASGSGNAPGILLEDELAARIATQHLLDLGHTRLAYIAGPKGETSDSRRIGFESVLRAGQGTVVQAGWSADGCHEETSRYLRNGGDASGIIVVNSAAAVGVISAIHSFGLRSPEDVSVIGLHDAWFVRHLTPALTTVQLALPELGREAIRLLVRHIDDPVDGDLLVDQPGPMLVKRQSTGPAPSSFKPVLRHSTD